jgi:hypothetical protein
MAVEAGFVLENPAPAPAEVRGLRRLARYWLYLPLAALWIIALWVIYHLLTKGA